MKNKYYLLKFQEDWADEFDISAIACFTEEEFEEWKETLLIDITEEEVPKYKEWRKRLKKADKELEKAEKEHHKVWASRMDALKDHKLVGKDAEWLKSHAKYEKAQDIYSDTLDWMDADCILYTYLGNYGEGFFDIDRGIYHGELYAKELIDSGLIYVEEVSEDFYRDFHKHALDSVSLCNIFILDY